MRAGHHSIRQGPRSPPLDAHLRVRIVCWLEPDLLDTHLLEEHPHEAFKRRETSSFEVIQSHTNQVSKSETTVGDDTLDLVEFGQMRGVHCLVPENTVDTEELSWSEAI